MDKKQIIEPQSYTIEFWDRIYSGAPCSILYNEDQDSSLWLNLYLQRFATQILEAKFQCCYIDCSKSQNTYGVWKSVVFSIHEKMLEIRQCFSDDVRIHKIYELEEKRYNDLKNAPNLNKFHLLSIEYCKFLQKYLGTRFIIIIDKFDIVQGYFSREDFMKMRALTEVSNMVICSMKTIDHIEESVYNGSYLDNQFGNPFLIYVP